MSFKDKVVIITGASSGIGAATAEAFSSQGAKVVMVGRNETKLKKVAAKCSNPLVIVADVTKDEDVKRIVDETLKKFGQIDILVNNAGGIQITSLLDNRLMEVYDTIMNINLRCLILLTNLVAPHLGKTKGNIVNVSSVAGHIAPPIPGLVNYCVSKAAVTHFGKCAATELSPLGVRVNTVSPGPVRTAFMDTADAVFDWEKTAQQTALNRVSEPEEIADVIMFLASDKAKGITGSEYIIDNGVQLKGALPQQSQRAKL